MFTPNQQFKNFYIRNYITKKPYNHRSIDFYTKSHSNYEKYYNLFELIKLREDLTTVFDCSLFLLIINKFTDDIYLTLDLMLGMTYYIYLKYNREKIIHFILGSFIGCFSRIGNFNIKSIIKINSYFYSLLKNLYFISQIKTFVLNKSHQGLKESLLFLTGQFYYYESTKLKAEIFVEICNPILRIKELKEILCEEVDKKSEKPMNKIIEYFSVLFFLPFLESLGLNTENKDLFFNLWDKRGFFRYILFKKKLLSDFKMKIN